MTSSKRIPPTTAKILQDKLAEVDILKASARRYQSLVRLALDTKMTAREILETMLAENDIMMDAAQKLLNEVDIMLQEYRAKPKFLN